MKVLHFIAKENECDIVKYKFIVQTIPFGMYERWLELVQISDSFGYGPLCGHVGPLLS